jgi:hypothetical protein
MTTYVHAADLEPLADSEATDAALLRILERLVIDGHKATEDWDAQVTSLTHLRRVAVHHPDVANRHAASASKLLPPLIRSLRSVVSKTAMLALQDLSEAAKLKVAPVRTHYIYRTHYI